MEYKETDAALLKEAKRQLLQAQNYFDHAETADQIDFAVFNLATKNKRYQSLLHQARLHDPLDGLDF